MTRQQIEEKAGVYSGCVTNLLKDRAEHPDVEVVRSVCAALEPPAPFEWVYYGRREPAQLDEEGESLREKRQRIARRYEVVREWIQQARGVGASELELDIAVARVGEHKGAGPTEDELDQALRYARARKIKLSSALGVGSREATDADLGDDVKS